MDPTLPSESMIKVLFEHRFNQVRSGSVNLLPYEAAHTQPGFISVFGYPEEAQQHILGTNTTAGLRGVPLYCDLIYLDFDDNEQGAADAEHTLQRLGLHYELFSTGRPGRYHFHIPAAPLLRSDVPFRVMSWVTQNFHGTDNSLYKTSGIIRTEGTFHNKAPGKRKEWLRTGEGCLVDIMTATRDVMPRVFTAQDSSDAEAAEVLENLWVEPCYEGGRNRQVYRRAYLAKIAGIDLCRAEELLKSWNELMVHPPLYEGEVVTTVRSAYRG